MKFYQLIRSVINKIPGSQRLYNTLYNTSKKMQPQEHEVFQFLSPGDLFFDIGAHTGEKSKPFINKNFEVVMVEPQPKAGALWASERWFARANPALAARLRATRREVEQEFGWKARLAARVVGPVVLATLWREERRLRRGRTYEPPTFYEANPAAAARTEVARRGTAPCRWVEPPARAREAVA